MKQWIRRGAVAAVAIGLLTAGYLAITSNPQVAEARCRAGAYIAPSDTTKVVASDGDADQQRGGSSSKESNPSSSAIGPNLVANGGLEQTVGNLPENWDHNLFGTNNAGFQLISGHNSAAAARTTITKYTDGDSNWYYHPIAVTPGGYYEYEDSYRANVPTRTILEMVDANGQMRFINLHSAPASADWTTYRAKVIIPADVQKIVIYHTLSAVGTLDVDDASVRAAKLTGFDQPRVSITFDDGWKSIHEQALPLLKKYDLPSTQYIITGYVDYSPGYMTAGNLYDFKHSGSEIASHTVSHADLTKQDERGLAKELGASQRELSACYGDVTDFAAPYGSYNEQTLSELKKRYTTARSTDEGYNTADNFFQYALKVQNVDSATTPEQLQSWLDTAKANNAWLILVYHQINDPSQYSRTSNQLDGDLKLIKNSGLTSVTVRDGYKAVAKEITK